MNQEIKHQGVSYHTVANVTGLGCVFTRDHDELKLLERRSGCMLLSIGPMPCLNSWLRIISSAARSTLVFFHTIVQVWRRVPSKTTEIYRRRSWSASTMTT